MVSIASSGTKRTWIFLRGLIRHQGHWGDFLNVFQKSFPNDEVICLDLAGNGSEHQRKSFLNLKQNVVDLRERLNAASTSARCTGASLPRKYFVLGVSMGAMVGLEWQSLFPAEVLTVIAINTSSSLNPVWHRFPFSIAIQLPGIYFSPPSPRKFEEKILHLTAPTLEYSKKQKFLDRIVEFKPTSRFNLARQLFAASGFRPRRTPGATQVFLAGQDDALANPSCSRRLARFYGCPIRICAGGGHDLPLTHANWICEQINQLNLFVNN